MYPRTASFTDSGNWETVAGDLVANAVLQLGIHREGHLQDVFERRLFELALLHGSRRAHARQIVAVDGVHHLFEAALIFLAIGRILIRGLEHQIDGRVELPARSGISFAW